MRSAIAPLALALVLPFFFVAPAIANDPTLAQRIETLQQQGYEAYSRGRLDRAADLYFLALRAAVDNGRSIDGQFHETVKNLANILAEMGRLDDAQTTYDRIIPAFEEAVGADHPWSLDLKADFAQLLSGSGRVEVAVSILEPVLAAYRRSPPADAGVVPRVAHELGVAYVRAGQPAQAIPLLNEAAAAREAGFGLASVPTLTSYVSLAMALDRAGRVEESDGIYARILPVIDSTLGPEHPLALAARTNLAGRLQEQGRVSEAIPLLRESLRLRAARLPAEAPDVMTSRILLANGLLAAGEVEEALALHAATVQIAREAYGAESPPMIQSLGNYSAALRAAGRTERAAELDRERLEIARRTLGPASYEAAMAMNDVAIHLRDQGQLGAALRMLSEAYAALVSTVGADDPRAIDIAINLAALAPDTEPPEQVRLAYEDAIRRARRVFGPTHPVTIRAEVSAFNRGFGRGLATGEDAAAFVRLAEIARATHGPDSDVTRNVEQALVLALGESPRPSDHVLALETARRALDEAATRISRPRDDGDPGLAVVTADFRTRAFAVANLAARAAESPAPLPEARRNALRDEAFRAAQMMGFGPVGNATRTAAMRAAARRAGLTEDLRAWERTLAEISARTDAYARAILSASTEDLARVEAETGALKAERARLETLIAQNAPGFFDLLTPRTVGIAAMREGPGALRPDEALVLIAPAPSGVADPPLVWAISREAVGFVRAGMNSPELDRAVATFHASLAGATGAVPGTGSGGARSPVSPGSGRPAVSRPRPVDLALGHEIYAALFGAPAIQAVLKGKSSIILAPQGSLLSLPFSALPMAAPAPEAGATAEGLRAVRWFGLGQAQRIVPSAASIAESRSRAQRAVPGERRVYVGFGDPAFASPARPLRGADVRALTEARDRIAALSALPALPATAWEISAVADAFPSPRTRTFLGTEASEARFRDLADKGELDGVSILHFATHGLLGGALSGLSEPALALSPPAVPRVLDSGEVDDGLLTASEIAARDFDADWVVLSACDTAAGETAGAEGLSGLAKAFFFAGAGSLLVTHWAVLDDAAARIIVATVNGTRAGLPTAEAQRRAIAELIADPSRDGSPLPYAHPAVWAPFEVIGEPG